MTDTPLNYEPNLDAAIQALLIVLSATPYNLPVLQELRQLAIQRQSHGKLFPITPATPVKPPIVAAYLHMARLPLSVDPLFEIARLTQPLLKTPDPAPKEVYEWTTQLLKSMISKL